MDPQTALLYRNARPDVIDKFLFRDNLASLPEGETPAPND